jgi:mono/diheme cytochrome c family protein
LCSMFSGKLLCAVMLAAGLGTACALHSHTSGPINLTPAEARGKIIYTRGVGASGTPVSYRLLGAGDGLLPARGVYCANCHGPDGKGGREGEIVMADIRYATLLKPLPASPPWYRGRGPYTDATFARAITQGMDSSGNQLDASMPRWVLSPSELQDLLQYVKRLGRR